MAKHRLVDKCKLCGFTKELRDSHYLPKRLNTSARAGLLTGLAFQFGHPALRSAPLPQPRKCIPRSFPKLTPPAPQYVRVHFYSRDTAPTETPCSSRSMAANWNSLVNRFPDHPMTPCLHSMNEEP